MNAPTTDAFLFASFFLSLSQWLRKKNFKWNTRTCDYAAQNGDMEMLKYCRSNKCPWSVGTANNALRFHISKGNTDMFMWLLSKNCPINTETSAIAAAAGDVDILKILLENDCPMDRRACFAAAKGGHLKVHTSLPLSQTPSLLPLLFAQRR